MLTIVLELSRQDQAADPFAFQFAPQEYVLRGSGGGVETARFDWSQELLADLTALRLPGCDPTIAPRIGELLRRFLFAASWAEKEAQILEAAKLERPIILTLRFAAAELYALPWELCTCKSTGQHLGELPGLLLRYEWPETATAIEPTPRQTAGRILFAWSAAGGAVPAAEQLCRIAESCEKAAHPFDRESDVVQHASPKRIVAALEAAKQQNRPIAVLHLLCHGVAAGRSFGLSLDGEETSGEALVVDAGRLRQLLGPYTAMVKLVVLSACDSGNSGALGNQLGSIAQTLHRAGIASVVASRYPLAVAASLRMTQTLYDKLIDKLVSLEDALRAVRTKLAEDAGMDWASVQLYARSSDGNDTRPLVFRPFRGLLAFQPRHHRFFFGRDAVIDEICSDLAQLESEKKPRFLVVAGASGTGKSSVVLAGAVPRLCLSMSESRGKLRFVSMRPGADPEAALTQALADGKSDQADAPILLVVDQLEELFTHNDSAAKRQTFVRRLWELSRAADAQIRVIATLRVDFIGRCGELVLDDAGLRLDAVAYDETHRVFVSQMNAQSLRAAIEEPPRRVGLMLEEGLSQRMLADVGGEPGALPLLEDTLDILWQKRSARTLTQAAYDEVGGVAGALSGRADALILSMSQDEQRVARRLIVRLVSVADDITLSTRRRVPLFRLRPSEKGDDKTAAARFDRVLSQLIDARLLVRDGEGAAQMVEVAHEALIRKWSRLAEWVKADRKMLDALSRIEVWVKERADMGTLLLRSQIGFVEQFVKDFGKDELPPEAHALLDESNRFNARRLRRGRIVRNLFVLASLALAAVGGFGLYMSSQVTRAASATRDTVRLSSLRTVESRPSWSLELLRQIEAEDPDQVRGFSLAASENLRDVAQPVAEWTIPLPTGRHDFFTMSPSCNRVAIVRDGDKKDVRIYEQQGEIKSFDLPLMTAVLRGAALHPDGKTLVVFYEKSGALVFDIEKGTQPIGAKKVEAFAVGGFTVDGKQLLTIDQFGQAHEAWPADNSDPKPLHIGNNAAPKTVSVRDGGWLWATPTLSRLLGLQMPQEGAIRQHAYQSNVELWTDSARRVIALNSRGEVRAATMCSEPNRLGTVELDDRGLLLRARTWTLGQPPLDFGSYALPVSGVRKVRFAPDGKRFIVALPRGVVQIFNTSGFGASWSVDTGATVRDFYLSADNRFLLVQAEGGAFTLWRTFETSEPRSISNLRDSWIYGSPFSPDSRHFVVIDREGKARVYDTESGEQQLLLSPVPSDSKAIREREAMGNVPLTPEQLLAEKPEHISRVIYSPDGKKLAASTSKRRIVLFHADSGEVQAGPELHSTFWFAFSADGKRLVTMDTEKPITWHSIDGSNAPDQPGIKTPYAVVSLSADGRYVSWGTETSMKLSLTEGSAPPVELPNRALTWVHQFSADGARFLASFDDKYVALWRTAADPGGAELQKPLLLPSSDLKITSAELSDDGRYAIVLGSSGTPTVWAIDVMLKAPSAALRRRLWELQGDCMSDSFAALFIGFSSQSQPWDETNCRSMRSCLAERARAHDTSESGFAHCLSEFRSNQSSWLRESTLQRHFMGLFLRERPNY